MLAILWNRAQESAQEVAQEWGGDLATSFDWTGALQYVSLAAFLTLIGLLVFLGLTRTERLKPTRVLSDADRKDLADEIEAAEKRTVGEIAVVVLGRSDRHPAADWVSAFLFVVVGSTGLADRLPWDNPLLLLTCQGGFALIGLLGARLAPGYKRLFITPSRATEMAQEQAIQEFHAHGLHRTQAETGVLLFVSLLEHQVIVLGDRGITAKLDATYWESVDQAIIGGIRTGSLKAGLHEGIQRCADVLEQHFPGTHDDIDEVPNHVIVRDE